MTTKEELVEDLIKNGVLKTPRIIEAFERVDRVDFVLSEFVPEAYNNHPLPIGEGQTISQPLTVAYILEQLQPKEGEKILDIGAGSGWQTALLAYLVGKKGKVVGVERIESLYKMTNRNIKKYKDLSGRVGLVLGDGSKGYKKEAPFSKIVAAASARKLPEAWKKQLKIGGRIVAPVESSIVVWDKVDADKFDKYEHHGFAFVPLIEDEV